MQSQVIKGSLREKTGRNSTIALRKKGLVPCVMYGGEKNIHFYTEEKSFKDVIFTPEVFLIKLDLEGEVYEAIIQDIQYHPVSDDVIHVDMKQVFPDKEVILEVPIKLVGNSIGLQEGGKLRQRRRHIKIRGLIADIPRYLDVDLTEIHIGDFVLIQDLEFDKLEVLDPPRAMVAGVISSRVIAKGLLPPEEEEPEEAEAVEGEEGEEGEGEGEERAESAEASEGGSEESGKQEGGSKES